MNFREVVIRAAKTFIQSFFGVLIPELCMVLSKAVPDATFWTVSIPPLFCAALAAGISAAWNIVSIALAPDELSVSNVNPVLLSRFESIMSVISEFEVAAAELVNSDFSVDALANYSVIASELASVALAELASVSSLLVADEVIPSEQ